MTGTTRRSHAGGTFSIDIWGHDEDQPVTEHDWTTEDFDRYEQYEDQFDPLQTDRRARRKRKPRARHIPKVAANDVIDAIADTDALEGGVDMTYSPSRYEEGWLLESIKEFHDQALITDVLALVKGGKEASVYRCAAHPSVGVPLLAAKVYRPRMFRQLRNDKVYRQGRGIITADGIELNASDRREMRAIQTGSAYGRAVQHTSWLMHEYTTLQRLYQAGGAVPRPFGVNHNTILMSYHGDALVAAPTLNTVTLEPDEARALFQEMLRNVELMLQHDLVHGDLSAYNALYWEGRITIIDFPQVIDINHNPDAFYILARDIARVCEYFATQGIEANPEAITGDLWYRYGGALPDDPAVMHDPLV